MHPLSRRIFNESLSCRLQNDSSLPMVYHQVLEASTNDGAIQTNLLYPILLLSGLDRPLLGHIWSMVNYTLPGQLVAQELYMGLALIAHAQVCSHNISHGAIQILETLI